MKTFKLLFVLFAFLVSLSAFSQEALFRPGYVITHENDTVYGEVRYTSGQKDNRICVFRQRKGSSEISYQAGDIHGYGINEGKFFIAKEVPVYRDTMNLFVEYLLKGRASFYYLEQNGIDHYYIETDNYLSELTENDTVIAVNGEEYRRQREKYNDVRSVPFRPNPRYYGKLRYLLSDCPEIQPMIESVEMNHTSLIKLGQDYHHLVCGDDGCIVFERTVKPVRLTVGPMAGYSLSVFDISGTRDNNMPGAYFGVSAVFRNPFPEKESLSVRLDAYLQYNKYISLKRLYDENSVYIIKYNDVNYYLVYDKEPGSADAYVESFKADLELFTLKVPIQMVMNISLDSKRWSLAANAGPLFSFTVSQNDRYIIQSMVDQFGHTIPFLMFGANGSLSLNYRTRNENVIFCGLNGELLTSRKGGNYDIAKARSLGLQLGLRF